MPQPPPSQRNSAIPTWRTKRQTDSKADCAGSIPVTRSEFEGSSDFSGPPIPARIEHGSAPPRPSRHIASLANRAQQQPRPAASSAEQTAHLQAARRAQEPQLSRRHSRSGAPPPDQPRSATKSPQSGLFKLGRPRFLSCCGCPVDPGADRGCLAPTVRAVNRAAGCRWSRGSSIRSSRCATWRNR